MMTLQVDIRIEGDEPVEALHALRERLRTDEPLRHVAVRLLDEERELVVHLGTKADVRPLLSVLGAWLADHPGETIAVSGERLSAASFEQDADAVVRRILAGWLPADHLSPPAPAPTPSPPPHPIAGSAERTPPGPPFDDDDDEW